MSDAAEAADAGRTAGLAAMDGLAGAPAALVIVYVSGSYDLPALLAGVRNATGNAPLVGATTAGQFADGAIRFLQPGVAVLAVSAGNYRFGIASASGIGDDLDGAGQRLARASRAAAGPAPHGAVILLSDWSIGDLQQLIHGIYRVTGPRVPTVGGAASDMFAFAPTSVFHDSTVLEQGAVAVWVASDTPLHVITRHGWMPVGIPLLAGRADGMDLQEIDGRPAVAAYQAQLGLSDGTLSDEDFRTMSLQHPIGILEADGSILVRAVVGRSTTGGLATIAPVPVGCAIQVVQGTPDSLLACVEGAARDAIGDRQDAGVLLTFSCVARAQVCGERIAEEPRLLSAAAGGLRTFGFYTYGEYGRTRGVLGTHNATLTTLAL